MTTKFRCFDPTTIRKNAAILFAGGKGSGKSTVMREFMWYLRHKVYDGHAWSGTIDDEHRWEWYFPEQMVHYSMVKFDSATLDEAMKIQERRKAIAAQAKVECPSSIFVFEDLEFLKPSMWKFQQTRQAMFNGRWSKIFCFVAFQYVMEVKMEMRGNFDYAVFTFEAVPSVRQRIFNQFGKVFGTFDRFDQAFKLLTKNYSVIVFDLRARSYNLTECVLLQGQSEAQALRNGPP